MKRLSALGLLLGFALVMGGCISMGKFERKEQEALNLGKDLKTIQQQYDDLKNENKAQIDKLNSDVAGLANEKTRLTADNLELDKVLKASKSESLIQIIGLRQRVADLESADAKLKENILSLQKTKEDEVKKVSVTLEEMTEKMKEQIAKGDLTIRELRGKLTLDMKAELLFDSGKAEIKPAGIEVLGKMIGAFSVLQGKVIRIEGHTDNKPITATLSKKYPTNWELSAARAINVTRYLEQQGVDPHILSAVAHSEFQPKPEADNNTEEGRASNRRIEIILVNKD
ncbi:MAG: OmpA family protein [Geobacteraceae bacterium]